MDRVPGRETRLANRSARRTWYGYGEQRTSEKGPWPLILHDASSIAGEVSFTSLPVLLVLLVTADERLFGITTAAVIALTTLVIVGTAIRGGWIKPPATEVYGWVSLGFTLVGLRVLYYNTVLAIAIFGSVGFADAIGVPALSAVTACLVSLLAGLYFPRIGQSVYHRLHVTN